MTQITSMSVGDYVTVIEMPERPSDHSFRGDALRIVAIDDPFIAVIRSEYESAFSLDTRRFIFQRLAPDYVKQVFRWRPADSEGGGMKILCGCGRFLSVVKNGVTVEELTEDGQPYRLWDADRWACPECGTTVISGFGREPMVEHWQPTYAAQRERLQPVVTGRHTTAENALMNLAADMARASVKP